MFSRELSEKVGFLRKLKYRMYKPIQFHELAAVLEDSTRSLAVEMRCDDARVR
jgi:hypothetical protein